jgi:hypothetical protein
MIEPLSYSMIVRGIVWVAGATPGTLDVFQPECLGDTAMEATTTHEIPERLRKILRRISHACRETKLRPGVSHHHAVVIANALERCAAVQTRMLDNPLQPQKDEPRRPIGHKPRETHRIIDIGR